MKTYSVAGVTTKWPTGLKSADEIAAQLGLKPERLVELAMSGFAPHYRIDGGDPLFRVGEVKEWAAVNLLQSCPGQPLPEPIRIVVQPEQVGEWSRVPPELREIENLRDITGEVSRIGIYFLCYQSRLQYIGQSINAVPRVADHQSSKRFDASYFLPWPKHDLNRIEGALIRALKPSLNGRHGPRGSTEGEWRAPGCKADDETALKEIGLTC